MLLPVGPEVLITRVLKRRVSSFEVCAAVVAFKRWCYIPSHQLRQSKGRRQWMNQLQSPWEGRKSVGHNPKHNTRDQAHFLSSELMFVCDAILTMIFPASNLYSGVTIEDPVRQQHNSHGSGWSEDWAKKTPRPLLTQHHAHRACVAIRKSKQEHNGIACDVYKMEQQEYEGMIRNEPQQKT